MNKLCVFLQLQAVEELPRLFMWINSVQSSASEPRGHLEPHTLDDKLGLSEAYFAMHRKKYNGDWCIFVLSYTI